MHKLWKELPGIHQLYGHFGFLVRKGCPQPLTKSLWVAGAGPPNSNRVHTHVLAKQPSDPLEWNCWNPGLWQRHDHDRSARAISAWSYTRIFVGQRRFPLLFLYHHHRELNNQSTKLTVARLSYIFRDSSISRDPHLLKIYRCASEGAISLWIKLSPYKLCCQKEGLFRGRATIGLAHLQFGSSQSSQIYGAPYCSFASYLVPIDMYTLSA